MALLAIVGIFAECSKDSVSETQINDKTLSNTVALSTSPYDKSILKDPTFRNFVLEEFRVMNNLDEKEILKFKNVTITTAHIPRAVAALGFNSVNDYTNYSNGQSARLSSVEQRFHISRYPVNVQETIYQDIVGELQLGGAPTGEYMSCKWKKHFWDGGVIGGGDYCACWLWSA